MSKLNVGFTGSQSGMTRLQEVVVHHILLKLIPNGSGLTSDGDCIGSDAKFREIAKHPDIKAFTNSHPPINESKRAFAPADNIFHAKDYIPRNHDIVDTSDIMIATPDSFKEKQRSGTWATIRYSWRISKPIIIISPNGICEGWNLTDENQKIVNAINAAIGGTNVTQI